MSDKNGEWKTRCIVCLLCLLASSPLLSTSLSPFHPFTLSPFFLPIVPFLSTSYLFHRHYVHQRFEDVWRSCYHDKESTDVLRDKGSHTNLCQRKKKREKNKKQDTQREHDTLPPLPSLALTHSRAVSSHSSISSLSPCSVVVHLTFSLKKAPSVSISVLVSNMSSSSMTMGLVGLFEVAAVAAAVDVAGGVVVAAVAVAGALLTVSFSLSHCCSISTVYSYLCAPKVTPVCSCVRTTTMREGSESSFCKRLGK